MKGTYLFPQSFIVSAVLLARDLVRHPWEIGITELLRSELSSEQAVRIIRAMNALHTKHRVNAHHAERSPLHQGAELLVYKLRRFGLNTPRPIDTAEIHHEWRDLKPETVARLFSFARVIPDFPNRLELPPDMRGLRNADGYRAFDRETQALRDPDLARPLMAVVESAYDVAVHEPKFLAMTRGYKALIKKIGSTSPQADVLKDRISQHLVDMLMVRHPDLDWDSYVDYRHPPVAPRPSPGTI